MLSAMQSHILAWAAIMTMVGFNSSFGINENRTNRDHTIIENQNKTIDLDEFIESLLNSYDKRIRPGAVKRQPTLVTCDIFINDFSSVNERDMEYSLDIFFRQSWKDERLAYQSHPRPIVLGYSRYDMLWVPDTFFTNEKIASRHDVTTPNKLLRIEPDGTILFSQRLSLTLSCHFILTKFPMDNQTCQLHIESYGYTSADLILIWRKEAPLQWKTGLELAEFNFGKDTYSNCTHHYNTGVFSCINVIFALHRRMGFYFIQTYIPSMLIVILSWISFWLDVNATPARISVGLLTVLTMTTQSTSQPQLPRVSYVKAIDVWQSGCLIFVFGAMIEFAVANVFARREAEEERKRLKRGKMNNSFSNSGPNIIGTEFADIRPRQKESPSQADATSAPTHQYRSSKLFKFLKIGDCRRRKHCRKSECLETFSRIFFPLSFGIFNIVYWLHYVEVHKAGWGKHEHTGGERV